MKYYGYWVAAGLVMPLLVAAALVENEQLILLFWPSSIILMSSYGDNSSANILITWGIAIAANVGQYLLLGSFVSFVNYQRKKAS